MYSVKTAQYMALAPKLLRMNTAPAFFNIRPIIGKFLIRQKCHQKQKQLEMPTLLTDSCQQLQKEREADSLHWQTELPPELI